MKKLMSLEIVVDGGSNSAGDLANGDVWPRYSSPNSFLFSISDFRRSWLVRSNGIILIVGVHIQTSGIFLDIL